MSHSQCGYEFETFYEKLPLRLLSLMNTDAYNAVQKFSFITMLR